jgi:hypothetical protein
MIITDEGKTMDIFHIAQLLELIKSDNPYTFRPGRWARVIEYVKRRGDDRLCYLVRWNDGVTDYWPIFDNDAYYQFADKFKDADYR